MWLAVRLGKLTRTPPTHPPPQIVQNPANICAPRRRQVELWTPENSLGSSEQETTDELCGARPQVTSVIGMGRPATTGTPRTTPKRTPEYYVDGFDPMTLLNEEAEPKEPQKAQGLISIRSTSVYACVC